MAGLHFARLKGCRVMEAWDIIVLGDGPAALRAAAESAKTGASTLMMAVDGLGISGLSAANGIAAPLQESNNRGHREDTIRAGAYLCDQDIVNSTTAAANRQLDLLERWGVNFRRDSKGMPMVSKGAGHGKPRNANCGDATGREVQQVLEEQCMRFGVTRRGDQLPLSLVHSNQKINGLIAIDMINGRLLPLSAKAVIIADGGFEGAFSNGVVGLGLDLALQAGLPLRDMEFIASTPLAVKDTNLVIPMGILNAGAVLHEASGNELDVGEGDLNSLCSAVTEASQPVLDARNLNENAVWWGTTMRMIKSRTGIDMSKQTIAIECRADMTVGGIAVDENGRAVVGSWSRWFTGLYAAGDAACSGLHGAGSIVGNRLLDAMCLSATAGQHAGEWIKTTELGGSSALREALEQHQSSLSQENELKQDEEVLRSGVVFSSIKAAANEVLGFYRDSSSLDDGLKKMESIKNRIEMSPMHLDQTSLIANINLVENARAAASARLVTAAMISAKSRQESRGIHQRSDFPESNDEFLHHITVDQESNIGQLAIRKTSSGNWLLPPL
jgi:succinate dehydrogenase/fumarate reductase flavoprotein subunit